jgi:hypothetical protein
MPSPTPMIEVLHFDGCPNHEKTLALVERVASELGLAATIELTEVRDAEGAQEHRFWAQVLELTDDKIISIQDVAKSSRAVFATRLRTVLTLGPPPREALGRRGALSGRNPDRKLKT